MLAAQQLQQPVLRVVRVLILVDEDVAEGVLPVGARVGEALERLDREHQHVVEVDGVRADQPALVALVDLGDRLVVERGDPAHVLVRADQLVLGVRDLAVDPPRREALRVDAEVLEARPNDAHLVGLVVDREAGRVAEPLGLAAQHPATGGVEGEDPGRPRLAAEHPLEPLAHLARRLVRERDREDLVRLRPVRADQVRHAMGEHTGLPRARAGDDEQRAVDVQDGFALGRVQAGEEIIVRCDGHASMLAALPDAVMVAEADGSGLVQATDSSTTMPSSSLVSIAPGRNVMPPNSTATSVSPAPALPLGRGFEPSALIPIGRCRSTADIAHAAVDDEPGPAARRRETRHHVAEKCDPQRAAAVDDEDAAFARLGDARLEHDVVLEAANRRDLAAELRDTAELPERELADERVVRMLVEKVGGRDHPAIYQRTVSSMFAGCGVAPA